MNKRINSRRFDQLNDHFQENLFQKEESFENNNLIETSRINTFIHSTT